MTSCGCRLPEVCAVVRTGATERPSDSPVAFAHQRREGLLRAARRGNSWHCSAVAKAAVPSVGGGCSGRRRLATSTLWWMGSVSRHHPVSLLILSRGASVILLLELMFHFADTGFGGAEFGFGVVGAGAFGVEGGDVLLGLWVVPAQLSPFPPEDQVQRRAVALQAAISQLINRDRVVMPSTSRSPASLVPWNSPVGSNRQYSRMPRAA